MRVRAITECAPTDAESDFLQIYYEDQVAENHRRKIIVDPKLQVSLVSSLLIVFVLASGIYYVTVSFAFLEVRTIVATLQLPLEHPLLYQLERLERTAEWAFAGNFVGFAALIIWGGVHLSHRIAGPIFALSRHLERVAEGQTDSDLSFRKDDYFPELQKKFNRHMEVYRQQLAAARAGGV